MKNISIFLPEMIIFLIWVLNPLSDIKAPNIRLCISFCRVFIYDEPEIFQMILFLMNMAININDEEDEENEENGVPECETHIESI